MKYLYIDGKLDASVPATGNIATNSFPVRIGENAERPNRSFRGELDELQIWNRALSVEEIALLAETKLPENSINLIGYWPIDSGESPAGGPLAGTQQRNTSTCQ